MCLEIATPRKQSIPSLHFRNSTYIILHKCFAITSRLLSTTFEFKEPLAYRLAIDSCRSRLPIYFSPGRGLKDRRISSGIGCEQKDGTNAVKDWKFELGKPATVVSDGTRRFWHHLPN